MAIVETVTTSEDISIVDISKEDISNLVMEAMLNSKSDGLGNEAFENIVDTLSCMVFNSEDDLLDEISIQISYHEDENGIPYKSAIEY